MMLLLMQWPFKKYKSAPIRLFDRSAVLKFKQTDFTDNMDFLTGNEFTSLHVVSSVLRKGLQINTMISRCKKRGRGAKGTHGGGMAGNPWPALDSLANVLERA